MFLAFFSWWYGLGWTQVFKSFSPRLQSVAETFSVSLLIRTLFEPWKRIITPGSRNIADRFKAACDNAVSRVIGFFVRLIVLISAGIYLLFIALISMVEIIIWPLLPPAVVGLIIAGFVI